MVFYLTTGLEAASVLRSSSAVRAGMSQERLSRIDQMLDDAVQSNEIPGAVALIARRGKVCLLYTSPSPRDLSTSRMPSSA